MADSKLNVACVDCPYCDGENIIARVRSSRSELDFTDREIACKHCQSVFTLSESKPRIRTPSKEDLDAA